LPLVTDELKTRLTAKWGVPRQGKVRDIYDMGDKLLMISSDRISVYNHQLRQTIKDKGRLLNDISDFWFKETKELVPNHILARPDPAAYIVEKCKPLLVEVVMRRYMVGSLWKDYAAGKRSKCGIALGEFLKENQRLTHPILTPTFKSHDDPDATAEELIQQGVLTLAQWQQIQMYSSKLFSKGEQVASKRGLILVDTKYEFGIDSRGMTKLIDEIHTPDSSRYWFQSEYAKSEFRFPDKEFARKWVRENGYAANQTIPDLPAEIQAQIRRGYIEIFEALTSQKFEELTEDPNERILRNLIEKGYIK
jgi:phosphoribosylaminoimidazole-succinocarboxamide synthase